MSDNKLIVFVMIGVIGGIFLLAFFGVCGTQIFNLMVQPRIIVMVDGKEIYRGSNACVEESSLGSATHVQIGRGPFCIIPGPKYTSKDVTSRPE